MKANNEMRVTYILLIILIQLMSLKTGSSFAQMITLSDIRQTLESEKIKWLYHRTYQSLLDRVDRDGFLQESLTGRYPGMFPRTVGGAVSLFLETEEFEVAEKIINCTLESMVINDMERIPHVFLRQKNNLLPVYSGKAALQPEADEIIYDLGQGRFAALEITGPDKPISAVETAIKLGACRGIITMTIRDDFETKPLCSISLNTEQVSPGQMWHRFELHQPLVLQAGNVYYLRFDFSGFGYPKWYGLKDISGNVPGVFGKEVKADTPTWINLPDISPAFAIDCGNLRHEQQTEPYEIYCDWDQIDGQAHVLMAWARLALQRGQTDFEDQTYLLVAKLMDRTSDQPYFMWGRGHEISLNLIQNISFEHSREGRYWHVWDLLTQCVTGASLEAMIQIAERRGDSEHAFRWQDRLQVLKKGIDKNLTRVVEGKKIYLEMRLPNSAGGVPYTGMSWVNFGPIMSQWNPLGKEVMSNTVEVMKQKLLLPFKDFKYLAMEYDPDGSVNSRWIIGKGIGWEIEHARQEKQYERIMDWLEFLKAFHTGELFSESMYLNDANVWETGDGGNGEQSTWWCWAMARLRKDAGLPVIVSDTAPTP